MIFQWHCVRLPLPVDGNTSLPQTSWSVPGTHLMNALVRLCAITGVSMKLLCLARVDMTPPSPKTWIPKVWRIFVVAHAYKPSAYPPDRARVLRLMHRVARYFAACAANATARGDPRSLCFFEAISLLCSSCRSRGPMLRSCSHAASVGSLEL